jgi:hypothetical protein
MDNYTVKLYDYIEESGYDYGELNVDLNFYNSDNILIGGYRFDTNKLNATYGPKTHDQKVQLLNDFTNCLNSGETGKLDFFHGDCGHNIIEHKKGIVKFEVDGNRDDQQHRCTLNVHNSEQLQVAFSTLCTMFSKN